jgi:hypothetical protein
MVLVIALLLLLLGAAAHIILTPVNQLMVMGLKIWSLPNPHPSPAAAMSYLLLMLMLLTAKDATVIFAKAAARWTTWTIRGLCHV